MLDTCGLSCPTPVLMVQDALRKAPSELKVLCDSRVAVENITRYAASQGYQALESAQGTDYLLTLQKNA